jgi:phage terminase large subunit-like protein
MGRPVKRASIKSPPVTWDLSCPDWEARLRTGRSLIPPSLPLNHEAAEKAVRIFRGLRLADVQDTPLVSEAGAEWFEDIVRVLFGSLDSTWRERAIRELFLLVPKKNGKTTNGGLLMLTAFLMNQRPNATFIMTAPDHGVADIAYSAVRGAVELNDVLQAKLHIRDHLKTVVHRENKAKLQIMTFDPAALTGQKCAGVLIDELHVVAKNAKAASAIRQLRGGMLPFPEAFMVFISTQSEDAPSGVFHAELTKARKIRDGQQKGAMLPVLYELPTDVQADPNQWRDPACWHMVTPSQALKIPRLIEEFNTAEATGEGELRAWASQHLNVEIGLALHSDRWVGADFWSKGATKVTLEYLIKHSEVITVGIDGGGLDDMLGLAVLGREVDTGNWLLWTHAWIHPVVLQRRKSEAPKFRDFERDGDLTIVNEIGEDVQQVADYVEQVEKSGLLDRIGVDQAGIGAVVDAIVDKGIDHERIVGIPQGWRLVGAIKTAERKLAEGALQHGASALMSWCVGNAKVEPRGNAILITKQAAGTAKIDPLMAMFDAVALMAMNPKPRRKNYEVFFV